MGDDVKELTLPWPPKQLSPNARLHWSAVAKHKRAYRMECFVQAVNAGMRAVPWDGDIHLWIDFWPPDRRARDDDNLVAAFKAGRDGLADALGVDDKRFRIHPYVKTDIGGFVKVRFTPGP